MKLDRSSLITLVVIVAIIGVAAWFTLRIPNDEMVEFEPDSFQAAQGALALTDLDGNTVYLEQFAGKALVVNTWASWCPFCVTELPDFSELAQLYSEDELVVLAINRAEPLSTITNYLRSINALPGVVILRDETDSYYDFIGGFTMPETIFYDRTGAVVTHKRGFMTLEEMRVLAAQALEVNQ